MFYYLLNKAFPWLRGKLFEARRKELRHGRFVRAARALTRKH